MKAKRSNAWPGRTEATSLFGGSRRLTDTKRMAELTRPSLARMLTACLISSPFSGSSG
jgi:hypothetical protein